MLDFARPVTKLGEDMRKWIAIGSAVVLSLGAAACLNMPTPTAQITGAYTSGLRYDQFDCGKLAAEADSLARRENTLVIAQEQRVKSSQMQAFWWGFGQGDGVEAAELASVRGEKEAVRKAMEGKQCGAAAAQPATATTEAPKT
jgi:hypothetical protein